MTSSLPAFSRFNSSLRFNSNGIVSRSGWYACIVYFALLPGIQAVIKDDRDLTGKLPAVKTGSHQNFSLQSHPRRSSPSNPGLFGSVLPSVSGIWMEGYNKPSFLSLYMSDILCELVPPVRCLVTAVIKMDIPKLYQTHRRLQAVTGFRWKQQDLIAVFLFAPSLPVPVSGSVLSLSGMLQASVLSAGLAVPAELIQRLYRQEQIIFHRDLQLRKNKWRVSCLFEVCLHLFLWSAADFLLPAALLPLQWQ